MPPKPFKPPRPSSSSSKPKSRKSNTNTSTSPNIKPKPKPTNTAATSKTKSTAGVKKGKWKEKEPSRRFSARDMGLPSLSPDSEDVGGDEEEIIELGSSTSHEEETEEDDDDPFSSQRPSKPNHQPLVSPKETIPPPLLKVLVNSFFKDPENTKIKKDAQEVLGKYLDTFVREAIARCVWERSNGDGGGGGGFLEVEDLEKGAPQMVLDF